MRLLITLILLSSMTLVMGQSNNSDSKSEEEERRRLENQFKALKNFYINEQGLVVYQAQGSDAKLIEGATENTYSGDTLTILVDDFSDKTSSPITPTESISLGTQPAKNEDSGYNNEHNSYSTPENYSSNVVSISKKPANPIFANKESESSTAVESITRTETLSEQAIPDGAPVNTSRIIAIPPTAKTSAEAKPVSHTEAVNEPVYDEEELTEEQDAEEQDILPKVSSRKSVFDKDPSKYKTLEEAAMAAQDLLDKLKSEQSSTASSGSLSSRLSKGAGSSSLRKKQSSLSNSFASGNRSNRPMISEKTIEAEKQFEEANTPYTIEPTPTYYINGIEVDKSVVDKLKKTDVLSREVRSRNTQNPAGEVWIQLK